MMPTTATAGTTLPGHRDATHASLGPSHARFISEHLMHEVLHDPHLTVQTPKAQGGQATRHWCSQHYPTEWPRVPAERLKRGGHN